MNETKTVLVAMSGGVDSSVAASLLLEQGFLVHGITFDFTEREVAAKARRVAEFLGITHHTVNASQRFLDLVLAPAWAEYNRGRTPSPCVICNRKVKFALLLETANELGLHHIATGHYARLEIDGNIRRLKRGRDRRKDQSYFLFMLKEQQLGRLTLPLGEFTKQEVRALARKRGFENADDPESQDACFATLEDGFADALRRKFGGRAKPGKVLNERGEILGEHTGIHNYTIGQRKGLNIALGRRAYVTRIDAAKADIVLSADEREILSRELIAQDVVWTGGEAPVLPCAVEAKIRYRHRATAARLESVDLSPRTVRVVFEKDVRAVTPGQAVVFYQGDLVLGGGWIE